MHCLLFIHWELFAGKREKYNQVQLLLFTIYFEEGSCIHYILTNGFQNWHCLNPNTNTNPNH